VDNAPSLLDSASDRAALEWESAGQTGSQLTVLQQFRDPFTVLLVRLTPRHRFDVLRIHQEHLELSFQEIPHWLPVHAVDSRATWVTPQARSQSANSSKSRVKVANSRICLRLPEAHNTHAVTLFL